MTCITIDINGGTPVRKYLKIIFPWANFHFLAKLSFTDFASIIGADGVKSILY